MTVKDIDKLYKDKPVYSIAGSKKPVEELSNALVSDKNLVFDDEVAYIRIKHHYLRVSTKEAHKIIRIRVVPSERMSLSSAQITEVYKRISCAPELQVSISDKFSDGEMVVNTRSGVFNIMNRSVTQDRDKYFFNYVIDIEYKRNAALSDTPAFEHYVKTSLGEEQYHCLLRVIGYCLSSLTKARKAFFLVGHGSTGKSTILEIMTSVLNKGLIAHEPLHLIGEESAKSHFIGKRINVGFDSTADKLKNESEFKSLVANEWTTSREYYEKSIDFIPTLKMIFASNHPILFSHPDEALLDRQVILLFNNRIANEDKDSHLKEKLQKEIDVIISLCLDELKELVNSDYDFCMGEAAKSYLLHQRLMLQSAEEFIRDRMDIRPDGSITSAELNKLYLVWCQDNLITPLEKNVFLERVSLYHPSIRRTKVGPSTKRLCGFKGIAAKPNIIMSSDEDGSLLQEEQTK